MKKNRFVIVGLGTIGMSLIKRLPRDIDIVCIDLKPEATESVKKIRGDATVVTGDATSRLILEKAGVKDSDGVIITTMDEKVNTEVATILKEHFDTGRVISVGLTPQGTVALEELGVEVENIFTASATGIRNRLGQKARAAHAIGLEKNEILEVEVHPNSRLANKPIGSIAPIRWRIGIIYRDENIIMPRKDVILKPRDRVVILGDPAVLKTVSEILTFSFQRFPLEYGATVVTYLTGNETETFFDEIDYLFSIFPLNKLMIIYSRKASDREETFKNYTMKDNLKTVEVRNSVLPPINAIRETLSELKGDQGLVVISRNFLPGGFIPFTFGIQKKSFLNELANISACPIMLSMETFPYKKVAVPCVEGVNIQNMLETSLEIAASVHNEVSALLVRPSQYISSDEEFGDFDEKKKTISWIGLMYKSSIKTDILEGNPVRVITDTLKEFNLMVVDTYGWKRRGWLSSVLNPDVIWHIIRRSPVSTLLIPPVEESL